MNDEQSYWIEKLAALEEENAALRQKLTEWAREAREDVEDIASYATDYFKTKLNADLAKWQARAEGE